MKKAILISILAGIVVVLALSQIAWLRVWKASAECDGSAVVAARVFRNLHGDLLIDLGQSPADIYVVRESAVGIPNRSSLLEFPPAVFARYSNLPTVDIRTDKAGSVSPQLLWSPRRLSFIGRSGKTVQVSWK